MSVPHILHVFSTFVPAGPETRTVNLIEALGREFRHSIVAMDGRTDAAALFTGKADVRVLPSPAKAGSLATILRLRALIREEQPDVVCSYNWGAFDTVFAARSLRFPRSIHHEDGFTSDEAQEFKRRRVLARRWFLPSVHKLVVPSKRLEGIAQSLWKCTPPKLTYVPNGIHLSRFQPADGNAKLRAELGIPHDAPVLGWVGHLRPEKNPLRFLKCCSRVDRELGMHALVLGDGELRAELEEFAAKTPYLFGRVHFVGHQKDPAPYFRAMDVFVVSSDTEQMPVALLEAMGSALPVVTTDVGDVRSMLPDEQGEFVVPLEERESAWPLAERIDRMLADPARRRTLGAANRKRVEERFTFAAMLSAYRALYLDAAAAGSR